MRRAVVAFQDSAERLRSSQKRYTDENTGKTKKPSMLYMKFYIRGTPTVEPTGTTRHTDAKKILQRKFGEIARGRYIPANVDKTTFEQIKDMCVPPLRHRRGRDG